MDIRVAIGLTQEMTRYISTIHMSSDQAVVQSDIGRSKICADLSKICNS